MHGVTPWLNYLICISVVPQTNVLLTARPWAERGSCSARDFFFNRAVLALHVIYYYFFFFFFFVFFLPVTRRKPPLGQIVIGTESRNLWCLFAKSCWNMNVRKMLRILFSLLCIKYIFFWFYRSVRFKANVEYTEKGITSAMECADVAGFTFVTWQITLCFICMCMSAEATIINLICFLFCEYFLWV